VAHQNVAGVLTGRGLMDCLQYYDNCLFYKTIVNCRKMYLLEFTVVECYVNVWFSVKTIVQTWIPEYEDDSDENTNKQDSEPTSAKKQGILFFQASFSIFKLR
jgi:hypothetical protein